MSSQIIEIYEALAAKSVTVVNSVAYKDVTPAVKNLDELPANADAAKLPCRLLLPMGNETEQDHQLQVITFGGEPASIYTWKITDLLLWRKVTDGLGLSSVAGDLMRYSAAYLDMLRTFRYPLNSATGYPVLNAARVRRGAFQYPSGEGMPWYFGVEVVLTIDEEVE